MDMIHETEPDTKNIDTVTKPAEPAENVTREVETSRNETMRAVANRDARIFDPDVERAVPGFGEAMRRNGIRYLYQIGDGRPPATVREDRALARWVEIDKRRHDARHIGKPFQFTAAERALKARLLKAGLITNKYQQKESARSARKTEMEGVERSAKRAAARGDITAINWLTNRKEDKAAANWQRKWKALQKVPIDHLLLVIKERATLGEVNAALQEMMAAKGVQRSLTSLWRDFSAGWESANSEKRSELMDHVRNLPAMLERALG